MQDKALILICGKPASGKTTLSGCLASLLPNFEIIHSDERYGYDEGESELALLDIIEIAKKRKVIIEGVLVYRILRKALTQGVEFAPDLVIWLEADEDTIRERYASDPNRVGKSVKHALNLGKGIEKAFNDQISTYADLYAYSKQKNSWGISYRKNGNLSPEIRYALQAINQAVKLAGSLQAEPA